MWELGKECDALKEENARLKAYITKLDKYVEHRESCRSNGASGHGWSVSYAGKCNCGLDKVLTEHHAALQSASGKGEG
jgi:hypothetical protein